MKDFKEFLLRGNLVTTAVAFVIGLAFAAVITALVTDLVTPLVEVDDRGVYFLVVKRVTALMERRKP